MNISTESTFTWIDWGVIMALLFVMLLIGLKSSRSNKSEKDYLLGGKSLNSNLVGLSLFATLFSTLSYLSYPGEMIQYGPSFCGGLLAFPLVYWVVSRFLIPKFTELNVTSAYEILEMKLGGKSRNLATVFFISLRFLWMSTIIYATVGTALAPILGIKDKWVPLICIALVLITVLYTTIGGMKAVVITDSLQSIIMFLGVSLTIVVILIRLGSFDVLADPSLYSHWLKTDFIPNPRIRMNMGNNIVMVTAWHICTAGSDQMSIQRYLSVKDAKAARHSFGVSLISTAVIQSLLAVTGMLVMVYFTVFPQFLEPGTDIVMNADRMFPRFILVGLPAGVTGLIAAALLSAAMSSLSSGLNSTSTVIQEDVLKRMKRFEGKEFSLDTIKKISLILGLIVAVSSSMVGFVSGNLYDIVVKLVNLVVAPLFVLFFMALFIPFATDRGTVIGGCFSMATAIGISFFGIFGFNPTWIVPSAFIVGAAAGVAASWIDTKITGKNA